jgi:hypothetical protein
MMPMLKKGLLLLSCSIALATASGCGEEPTPAFPTFKDDVRPLMLAHCVRCHGAGGKLNQDLYSGGLYANATPPVFAPTTGYFDILENDPPGCTTEPGCRRGLKDYVPSLPLFLKNMPPPPSPALTSREMEIVTTWLRNPLP